MIYPSAMASTVKPRRLAAVCATVLLALATPLPASASTAAVAVKVRGEVAHPRSFTVDRLRGLPQHTVKVRFQTSHGAEKHTYTGPLLADVLALTQPRIDPEVKNAQLRFYVAATGSDGYRATVAWAELDPGFSGRKVLLAVSEDGKALDKQGPRLVVPGDVKGGRYVSAVASLYVGNADTSLTQP